ncbi:ArsR/SmtB family transcription factor [Actinomyces polynesiensis]|uniref:ArsR/SmtB family transcription factor n=1 Tax=Actinomyces polynesiensis TaxID=1325934 RepID=UPI000693D2B3|nr:helix-turn-helix domain-containing protein [Actinomyces polynesiensis]
MDDSGRRDPDSGVSGGVPRSDTPGVVDDDSREEAAPWSPPHLPPEQTLEILKVIAHPIRLKIVRLLSLGEAMRVSDVAREVEEPANSVSYHLRQLARAGIVRKVEAPASHDARETWWQVPDWQGLYVDSDELRSIPGGPAALSALSAVMSADVAQVFSVDADGAPGWPGLQSDLGLRLTHGEAEELIDRISELVGRALVASRGHAASDDPGTHRYDVRLLLRARPDKGSAEGTRT